MEKPGVESLGGRDEWARRVGRLAGWWGTGGDPPASASHLDADPRSPLTAWAQVGAISSGRVAHSRADHAGRSRTLLVLRSTLLCCFPAYPNSNRQPTSGCRCPVCRPYCTPWVPKGGGVRILIPVSRPACSRLRPRRAASSNSRAETQLPSHPGSPGYPSIGRKVAETVEGGNMPS